MTTVRLETLNDWGAFVDDNRVMHGVTNVHPVDPQRPALRDVLVVTLKALPGELGG